jgi:exopolysaccharide biosynthesis WecB/TagA/CpsF family protein
VNAHTLNLAWADTAFHSVLRRASLVLNDGVGLSLAARAKGERFAHNFNGTDLFPAVFRHRTELGLPLRVFLYGARPGRAVEEHARVIAAAYPEVVVVGTLDGHAPRAEEEIVAAVNAARPDLLLVALGNPLQEVWIDRALPRLEVGVVSGVGALLDFLSGAVPRAPAWVRAVRAEWAYRLAREPRRLFARYVVGNPLFLARVLLDRAGLGPGAAARRLLEGRERP